MAGHLVICWNRASIAIAETSKGSGSAEIRSIQTIDWPDQSENLTNAELADWLKSELSNLKISADSCSVVVNREMTMHRMVEIPQVPDDEVYDLIKFQAATKLSTPLDQLVIDYVSIDDSEEQTQQSIMVVALAKKTIERINNAVNAAGMSLQHIQVSSHSLVELASHASFPEDSSQHAAVFATQDQRLEFAIYADKTCLFSHSTKLVDRSPTGLQRQINVELSRAALSIGRKASEITVAVIGQDAAAPFSNLDLKALRSVRFRSQEDLTEFPGWSAIVSGSLLSDVDTQTKTIDFLHPRRPQPKPDYTRHKQIGVGVAVAVSTLLAWGFWQWHLMSLDLQIVSLQKEDSDLKSELKAASPTFNSHDDLSAWDQKRANYLIALDEMNTKLPGTNQVYIEELSMTPGARNSPLRVTAAGQAKRRTDVETTFSLMTDSGFLVNPSEIPKNLADRDYPYRLDLDASLNPKHKSKAESEDKSAEKKGN